MFRALAYVLVAAIAAFTAPVAGLPARTGYTYPIAQAPAELRPAIQQADMAIVELQTAVLLELRAKLARDGPTVLMKSCHLWGVAAAYRVERQEGIAVGRTSNRLRNPKNAPRSWAAPIVELYDDRRPPDVGGFVVDVDDRVGVLRPIYLQASCGACHGPLKTLDRRVRAELDELYPGDRAVGYRTGDLRGWFWVEVPKKGP
ncbi:MAG TPA: DUF3365 domain-containing protein [Vicinamibacterales bacterium]|jgi:hypothetical protein|nr:DUF3365 domain-containing protein [Vicinamibacterales bacterium]